MDVALSILAGLSLRIFLFNTAAISSVTLSTAVLGIWEGAVLHQVSGRSSSPNLDHFLAYGLRLVVDLLISKDFQRLFMIVLWSTLGTITSEVITPYDSLRSAFKIRDRERDRRHRHTRTASATVPIPSTSFPPRLRAYKPPESHSTPTLPENPPPNTSTPILSSDQPPTPPSFFLQETLETIVSPSPKPMILQSLHSIESSPPDALPVRPRSGLASTFNHSSDSDSPLPVPIHLPTPPDSAQSANPPDVLNDVQSNEVYDNQILGFAPDLAPIPELSSPEDHSTPNRNGIHLMQNHPHDVDSNTGLQRISRWLESQPITTDPEPFFQKPFSPTTSPAHPIPVPFRAHSQDLLWQTQILPDEQHPTIGPDKIKFEGGSPDRDSALDTGSDELRTPGPRNGLDVETDNEHDGDPLQTPRQFRQDEDQLTSPHLRQDEGELSPLGINVRSALPDNGEYDMQDPLQSLSSEPEQIAEAAPNDLLEDTDNLQIPGSLSQNLLLQPPLLDSSPLFRPSSPPPEPLPSPSPSTILSDPSDVSILSTRVPDRLYSRADALRQQAREEEKLRAQLEEERKLAERQGRTIDALMLKIKVRDMDLAAYKLHEKAARRYFTGELCIAFAFCNELLSSP